MKTPYPVFLMLVAASASAQTAKTSVSNASSFGIGVSFTDVSNDTVDYDGYNVSARFRVAQGFFLTAGWTDASTGTVSSVIFATPVLIELDAKQWSLGLESVHAAGSGQVTLSLAYASGTLEGLVTDGLTTLQGDIIDNDQVVLGVRYDQELANGFSFGAGINHYINDMSFVNGLSSLGPIEDDSVTAPFVTVGYAPNKTFSLHVTYSTEDMLLGIPEADSSVSITAKLSF